MRQGYETVDGSGEVVGAQRVIVHGAQLSPQGGSVMTPGTLLFPRWGEFVSFHVLGQSWRIIW